MLYSSYLYLICNPLKLRHKNNLQTVCFDSAEGLRFNHFYLVVVEGSVK